MTAVTSIALVIKIMKSKIIFIGLALTINTTLAFANLSPEQELMDCSVKIRSESNGSVADLTVSRVSIDLAGSPDWEVGALKGLLRGKCELSDAAVNLLDREESSYLKTRRFSAESAEGAGDPSNGDGIIELYGELGSFFFLPSIGDQFTVVHHRAD